MTPQKKAQPSLEQDLRARLKNTSDALNEVRNQLAEVAALRADVDKLKEAMGQINRHYRRSV